MSEEQGIAQLETVKGDERHPYLLGIDRKRWGRNYDDFGHVVEMLKTEFLLTEDQAIAHQAIAHHG